MFFVKISILTHIIFTLILNPQISKFSESKKFKGENPTCCTNDFGQLTEMESLSIFSFLGKKYIREFYWRPHFKGDPSFLFIRSTLFSLENPDFFGNLKILIEDPPRPLEFYQKPELRIRIRSDPECFARIRIRNYHSGSGSDPGEEESGKF